LIPSAYQGRRRCINKGQLRLVLLFHCTININPKHIHDDTLPTYDDEAVELLDYIAMNDLENAYDAERDAISADMYDNCDPSEFSDTPNYTKTFTN
jgi:hypothetical protein